MLTEPLPPACAPVAIDEVKAFLRIDNAAEDAALGGFIRTATALAEAFTGQRLIAREVDETIGVSPTWQLLKAFPVVAITVLDGRDGPLPGTAFESDIDPSGNGWVRVIDPGAMTRLTVRYRAGLGSDWNAVPEPLRQGIVRLVSHLHAYRDSPDGPGVPAAVAALWRPWRRLRLG